MTGVRLSTPSRLHFGLLAYGPDAPRQFGGVGLAVERPGIEMIVRPASEWSAVGPLADRALRVARQVAHRLEQNGVRVPPAEFDIQRAPPEHAGLGTGTQLSLAVTRALTRLGGLDDSNAEVLADLSGRAQRSGIGLYGFLHGGLIVDGGHLTPDAVPPLLARLAFPADWAVLVVLPAVEAGLHGLREAQAFSELPPIPDHETDRLCRLVLLGMLPAVLEHDLATFGAALTELQSRVGQCFAPAQGGVYARPESAELVAYLRAEGLKGVGQSSWGPTLYGFSAEPAELRERLLARIRAQLHLRPEQAFWTFVSPTGCRVEAS
jgi:beta-RFAP synthase